MAFSWWYSSPFGYDYTSQRWHLFKTISAYSQYARPLRYITRPPPLYRPLDCSIKSLLQVKSVELSPDLFRLSSTRIFSFNPQRHWRILTARVVQDFRPAGYTIPYNATVTGTEIIHLTTRSPHVHGILHPWWQSIPFAFLWTVFWIFQPTDRPRTLVNHRFKVSKIQTVYCPRG